MRSSASIRLRDVSLQIPTFVQHQAAGDSWAKTLLGAAIDRPERQLKTILEGVDFEAKEGDRVALIGRNGAGKTTLLHLLTGCYLPTTGSVDIQGRRQALLNVSLGFNPEATVRENIFLRGAAMGLPMNVVRSVVGEVLEFAELVPYAGQRLATLSAGQRMRLGFAISTSVQPDIMLLDEWIGTGDLQFLQRARERMQDRVSGAHILVLASHSTDLLKRVCNRGVVIEKGRKVFEGSVARALAHYQQILNPHSASAGSQNGFRPQPLVHARHYGIELPHPVHVLFENRGTGEYGFMAEVLDATVSDTLAALTPALAILGLRPASFASQGAGLPNVFEFVGEADARARVTLTVYGADAQRRAPGAAGRVHLAITGLPA